MMDAPSPPDRPDAGRFEEALSVFQQYLSDQVAPLVLVDEGEDLTSVPSELLAKEIQNWISRQYRSATDHAPVSDFLYHVARKIQHLKDLQLLPEQSFIPFLTRVLEILVQLCPEADRAGLITDLEGLREYSSLQSGPLRIDQPSGRGSTAVESTVPGSGRPSAAVPNAQAQSSSPTSLTVDQMRRMELLLRRLESIPSTAPASTHSRSVQGVSQFVAAEAVVSAASSTNNAGELQELLNSMRVPGLPTAPEDILKVLAQRLPDWAAPQEANANVSPKTVDAVHKMVSLAETPQATTLRFQQLVKTAADEFNHGAIGRAVTLLDLARNMIDRKEIKIGSAALVRDKGHSLLDEDQVREFVNDESTHPLLKRVLGFFDDYSVEQLFAELETGDEREYRRLILNILQILGRPAREEALTRLRESIRDGGTLPWFLERNLIFLLREIPRVENENPGPEIDALLWLSQPNCHYATAREAMMTLGQIPDLRAANTLQARVADLERSLLGRLELPYEQKEIVSLLDRAIGALATLPLKQARRAAVHHVLANKPQFGDAAARIVPLAQQDLCEDQELVTQMVEAIRSKLPVVVFGRTVPSAKRSAMISGILQALSGTDLPQVRELLDEIIKGYPKETYSTSAIRILRTLESRRTGDTEKSATISGDLLLLSLPNLLQSISDAKMTGTLNLIGDGGGGIRREMGFINGDIVTAQAGHIPGLQAGYDLLQKNDANSFVFVSRNTPEQPPGDGELHPVLPFLLEAMRRVDEFQQAEALVPAEARFSETKIRPTQVADEQDTTFLRNLWEKASSGISPAQCETQFPVDSYRIRRCYEHWLQEGSLTPFSEVKKTTNSEN